MAQEGARKGASRVGPLSELILLSPVQWEPELCVKAGLLVMGVAEVTRRRGHKRGGEERSRSQVGGACQANDSCKGKF